MCIDFIILGVDFKNMPPCQRVLLNKIRRSNHLSHMVKSSSKNFIGLQDCTSGAWIINENNQMEIDYFSGAAYPDNIENIVIGNEDNENEDESNCSSSSDDDTDDSGSDSDTDWK